MIERFNRLSSVLATMIVQTQEFKLRKKLVEKIVRIAKVRCLPAASCRTYLYRRLAST